MNANKEMNNMEQTSAMIIVAMFSIGVVTVMVGILSIGVIIQAGLRKEVDKSEAARRQVNKRIAEMSRHCIQGRE